MTCAGKKNADSVGDGKGPKAGDTPKKDEERRKRDAESRQPKEGNTPSNDPKKEDERRKRDAESRPPKERKTPDGTSPPENADTRERKKRTADGESSAISFGALTYSYPRPSH